jgi:hypothetical protein
LAKSRRFPPRLPAFLRPSSFANSRRRKRADEFFAEFRASRGLLNSLKKFGNHPNSRKKIPLQNNNFADACKTQFRRRIEESKNPKKKKKEKLILVVSFGDGFVVVVVVVLASSSIIKGIDRL